MQNMKKCSHSLQVSKSQHSSTAVGGLQMFYVHHSTTTFNMSGIPPDRS